LRRARIAIQNAKLAAFGRERPGNAFADTRAAACNDRDAILEIEIHMIAPGPCDRYKWSPS
jgi:hypothetical protein